MQVAERRKLVSFGGERSSGRWVITTHGGRRILNSKPINWAKVVGYGVVIAFIIAIAAMLIASASKPKNSKVIEIQASRPKAQKVTKVLQIVPEISESKAENTDVAIANLYKTEKSFFQNDLVVELVSTKNQKKDMKEEEEKQEEKVPEAKVAVVAVAEKTAYVSAFSAGTEERIRIAMDIIVGNGFTPEAAAAIVGNALVESQLKPEVANGTNFFGLFQWSSSWWEHIKTWLVNNGYDIYSFEGQIRACIECPHWGCMSESRWETLKGLTNIDQAVELFTVFYEGCIGGSEPTEYYSVGTCYQALSLRKSEARQALNVYKGEGYTGSKPYYP